MSSGPNLEMMDTIGGGEGDGQAQQCPPGSARPESRSPTFTSSSVANTSPQTLIDTPQTLTGDSLTLLPEVAATGRPAGSRRPFQRRRRSRACDACRARKTKCDTPDSGPCSACAAASLVCKFSEGNEDRRRSGPARRIRGLEQQVAELTRKLEAAEAQLCSSANTPHATEISHPLSPHPPSSPRYHGSSSSITGSLDQTYGSEHFWWRPGHDEDTTYDRRPSSLGTGSGVSHHIFYSNPSFIASYKRYLRNLGYNASGTEFPHSEPGDQRVPLLSEYTSVPNTALPLDPLNMPLDLRVLLPAKPFAEKLLEIFRTTVQQYTPLFYWPKLEERFERAWAGPMWEKDHETVKSVFCVVEMLMAVASQMVETPELKEGGEEAVAPGPHLQERTGWKFFQLGRQYADLNNPSYTPDDAIFLLLMSMYLDNASLPSPSWMITGAMVRVCQDIGLDRRPPPTITGPVELESRRRLFWAAYIQERKLCLKKGRPCIFKDIDTEVGLPSIVNLDAKTNREALAQETGGRVGSLSPHMAGALGNKGENEQATLYALQCFKAQIHVSQLCDELSAVRLLEGGGRRDQEMIFRIDEKLMKAWEEFPAEYTNTKNLQPLEMGAIRPLFYLQYCRLILYRFFTESSPSQKLTPEFRSICLAQSVQVAKITAHLIFRTTKYATFDSCYGLRTDDLVQIQTFRAAVILLLGYCHHEPTISSVSKDEIEVCVRALRSVAAYHFSGKKLLHSFEDFAGSLNYSSILELDVPIKQEHDPSQHPSPIYITESNPHHQQPWEGPGSVYNQLNMPPHQPLNTLSGGFMPWDPSIMHENPSQQPHFGENNQIPVMPNFAHRESLSFAPGAPDNGIPIDWDVVQQALHFDSSLGPLPDLTATADEQSGVPGPPPSNGTQAQHWQFL
ncbi:fungal-specific transcription factor domain-containing protein [Geopyxis carbonaria]|nr:fungal-specific transcription factor domain-containing protein [Geopyxis carbonaria]